MNRKRPGRKSAIKGQYNLMTDSLPAAFMSHVNKNTQMSLGINFRVFWQKDFAQDLAALS